MAEKRMIGRKVLRTDFFFSLPAQAQALYFQLMLDADDYGFMCSAKLLTKAMGLQEKHLRTLESAGYLISFPSGVYAIRHWHAQNTLRSDRRHPPCFPEELKQLTVDANGVYELIHPERAGCGTLEKAQAERAGCGPLETARPATEAAGCGVTEQNDSGAVSSPVRPAPMPEKASLAKSAKAASPAALSNAARTASAAYSASAPVQVSAPSSIPTFIAISPVSHVSPDQRAVSISAPTLEEVRSYARERNSKVDPIRFYEYHSALGWHHGQNPIRDWKAMFRCWERKEKDFKPSPEKSLPPAARYEQRDYSGRNESMSDALDRILADTEERERGTES